MSREIKRVPLDFNWPTDEIWSGYLPDNTWCNWCNEDLAAGCPTAARNESYNHTKWEPTEPPTGTGWQLWENTTEGSPQSPVFPSATEFRTWLYQNPWGFGGTMVPEDQVNRWLASWNEETGIMDAIIDEYDKAQQ